jgi:hypothetical protein
MTMIIIQAIATIANIAGALWFYKKGEYKQAMFCSFVAGMCFMFFLFCLAKN